MEWRPIKTAPVDGTVVLLTDGRLLAAGARKFRIEDTWVYRGLVDGKITTKFTDRLPNPEAGKRTEWWELFGCSSFDESTDTTDWSYFTPTHWTPLHPPSSAPPAPRAT